MLLIFVVAFLTHVTGGEKVAAPQKNDHCASSPPARVPGWRVASPFPQRFAGTPVCIMQTGGLNGASCPRPPGTRRTPCELGSSPSGRFIKLTVGEPRVTETLKSCTSLLTLVYASAAFSWLQGRPWRRAATFKAMSNLQRNALATTTTRLVHRRH